ncbi:hypothetical protein HYV50_00830 [Candidatus Pacearchaeota archaeon]|nr:hypothetical protein [Candidatus Pacearchaeota archaeon]
MIFEKKIVSFFVLAVLAGTIFEAGFANAAVYRSFSGSSQGGFSATYQNRPSFETYYSGGDIKNYWPILGDRETCEARQDLLLSIAPAGCQPVIVRSDLLAEQNVPVFCQIDAYKINPLVDIKSIRNMRFIGEKPEGIVDYGFHPAKAALRTHDKLLGSPLVNNIGYVVLILKRQPDESKLPENINVTLSAQIEYNAGNSLGVGRAEFILTPMTEEEWQREKVKNSFWRGRYFVRLEEADSNIAFVSVYYGDKKVSTVRVDRGQTSRKIILPGMYCRASLEIAYDGFISAEKKAKIEVSSDDGTDIFDVYQGARFMDDRCTIRSINIEDDGQSGEVIGSCQGKEFVLGLNRKGGKFGIFYAEGVLKEPTKESNGDYRIDLSELKDSGKRGTYVLNTNGQLLKEGKIIVSSDGDVDQSVVGKDSEENKKWFVLLWSSLKEYGENKKNYPDFRISSFAAKNVSAKTREYYRKAIESYEQVADDYPDTKEGGLGEGRYYGEIALEKAKELAREFGMENEQARLINKLTEKYPEGNTNGYLDELNALSEIDSSFAGTVVEFDDRTRAIRLVSLSKPLKEQSAEIFIEDRVEKIKLGERNATEVIRGGTRAKFELGDLDVERARLGYYCANETGGFTMRKSSVELRIDEQAKEICGLTVKLHKTNVEKFAKIRLIPGAEGTQTVTNLTVGVGIEKRRIKLTPDKALEKIEKLNGTIKDWEKISKNLGETVTHLKEACFGTAAALTFKSFLSGLSGKSIARQEVMNGKSGWKNICADMVAKGDYVNLNACYLDKASEIESDVSKTETAINKINEKIKPIQEKHTISNGIFGKSINTDAAEIELAAEARRQYGDCVINEKKASELLSEDNVNSGAASMNSIRTTMLYCELQKSGLSSEQGKNLNDKSTDLVKKIDENVALNKLIAQEQEATKQGLPSPIFASINAQSTRVAQVVRSGNLKSQANFGTGVTHVSSVIVPASSSDTGSKFESAAYLLGLEEVDSRTGIYNVKEVWKKEADGRYTKLDNTPEFASRYGIGNIKSTDRVSYHNEISSQDREVRYYETEPYKGMPAVVPFDVRNGWYAATTQTLPAFGGIGAFDASGRVVSFRLCNVGENKRIEFQSGYGDDLCQIINLNTGQPLEFFPGLSESEARSLVSRAVNAVEEAARQYSRGQNYVMIGGERFKIGKPAAGIPETQCQDFMSPRDCYVLFNVCDPVICPSSRCDFGGKFPVANVQQSGIVGSTLLCLPNVREGIAVPVCLSGVQAGIDGWASILRNYRDCLQENVNTGRMVGICDQIYSVYTCEFFWSQVAPFVNVLIPKLVEIAYGQGTRGGGEYLTVNSAWQNAQNSMNYFTQSYAVNSLKAFQVRTEGRYGANPLSVSSAVEEVSGELCKTFISAKAPSKFKALVEPDSPPQFHAWFDSKTYSTATVPATAQYKLFYHIFSGKDSGVHFSVYLRNPPESSYYSIAQRVQVASGFIPLGQYASETKDFTAPEGYKELCVRINEEEECGFKQVSTSFAIDQLRDIYVKEQIDKRQITSESECIGGTSSAGALLNPNLQSSAEELISPEIYNRGVVRICASQNPGSATDPARFVKVGYCGNEKISCWLDEKSVSNAITSNNVGAINETIENLEKTRLANLEKEGGVLLGSNADAELKSLEDALASLSRKQDVETEGKKILERIEFISEKFVFGEHRARLLLIKGQVNEKIALRFFKSDAERENAEKVKSTTTSFVLRESYDASKRINLILRLGGTTRATEYYVRGETVFYNNGGNYVEIGKVITSDGLIEINSEGRRLLGIRVSEIDGARIEGWQSSVGVREEKCVLSEPKWVNSNIEKINSVSEGIVYLSVKGNNACIGEEVVFEIYEMDFISSDDLEKNISSLIGIDKIAMVQWDSIYVRDGLFGTGRDPEFYFVVRTKDDPLISSNSEQLRVYRQLEKPVIEEKPREYFLDIDKDPVNEGKYVYWIVDESRRKTDIFIGSIATRHYIYVVSGEDITSIGQFLVTSQGSCFTLAKEAEAKINALENSDKIKEVLNYFEKNDIRLYPELDANSASVSGILIKEGDSLDNCNADN